MRFDTATALIGGSFDPIHNGHLAIAKAIQNQLPEIRQIVFVPAALSPGKTAPLAPKEMRLRWAHLAAELEGMAVWDWELQQNGPSYTVSTLEEAHRLGAVKNRLFWAVGADAYASFPKWKKPERIRELCRMIVVNRPGHAAPSLQPEDILLQIPPHSASSTHLRELLAKGDLQGAKDSGLPTAIYSDLEKILPANNPYARK